MSGYIGNIPVPQATQTRQSFTATASQTTFNTAGYSPGYIDVFLNGVKLAPADYTATNGSDVVLAVGAASGDILETVAYEIFQVLDQDFSGDFTVDGSTFVVDSTNDRVGIGTSSPSDKLHVNGNGKFNNIAFGGYLSPYGDDTYINMLGSGRIQFRTNGSEAMRIDSSGNVGIGSTTPNAKITLKRSGAGLLANGDDGTVVALIADTTGSVLTYGTYTSHPVTFKTANGERMRIDSSGNVGIGTSSPDTKFHVSGGNARIAGTETSGSFIDINASNTGSDGATLGVSYYGSGSYGPLKFTTGGSERMRIDSSGNLLVGKTSAGASSVGFEARANGFNAFTRDGSQPLEVRRLTSDGVLIDLRKDSTSVGSIGVSGGNNPYFSSGVANHGGLIFSDGGASTPQMNPLSSGSTLADGVMNIGSSSYRFKDLYLSGGVYLGGVGSSNKLDDYEEGVWAPVITKGSYTPPVTGRSGKYTKIGNRIFFNFYWYSISAGSSSNSDIWQVSGLPFSVTSGGSGTHQFIMAGYHVINNVTYYDGGRWQANSSTALENYSDTRTSNHSSGVLEFSGTGVLGIF